MFDQPLVAAALVLALLVVGEIISIATRARVPMLFIVFMGYLIALWTGLFPTDIIDSSTLSVFGALIVAPAIVHMGTLIPMTILKKQYKAVLISLLGIVFASLLVLAVVTPISGYETAVSGVGPLVGGIIAFIITSEKLQSLGLTSIITVAALVLSFQYFVGLPLATNLLKKYAIKVRDQFTAGAFTETAAAADSSENKKEKKYLISDKYATPVILLFMLFVGGAIAVVLGNLTGIHYSLWSLAIGFIGLLTGVFRDKMMERANSFGITMVGIIFVVLPSMNAVTFSDFVANLPIVALILAVGAAGIILGGYIGSKIFKWDPNLGIPVALTAMFGFPADYIICEEISRTTGRTPAEEKYIFDQILSPLLIGGFTTVTVASIIVASVLMGTL
ncbi:hypothetical protein [Jeotgalibacillus soli]|uniref:Uncharacterized protein n=1 Tax=Jeotgalibacillus soli TaxID=889306 RepID=A0A0C2S2I6_9BACL|nr:hypothetical protein [Jeotgalibacillus soli]KIL48229.1 hypothetical protein KP78_16760 [Jeotgalibacillus soli]